MSQFGIRRLVDPRERRADVLGGQWLTVVEADAATYIEGVGAAVPGLLPAFRDVRQHPAVVGERDQLAENVLTEQQGVLVQWRDVGIERAGLAWQAEP